MLKDIERDYTQWLTLLQVSEKQKCLTSKETKEFQKQYRAIIKNIHVLTGRALRREKRAERGVISLDRKLITELKHVTNDHEAFLKASVKLRQSPGTTHSELGLLLKKLEQEQLDPKVTNEVKSELAYWIKLIEFRQKLVLRLQIIEKNFDDCKLPLGQTGNDVKLSTALQNLRSLIGGKKPFDHKIHDTTVGDIVLKIKVVIQKNPIKPIVDDYHKLEGEIGVLVHNEGEQEKKIEEEAKVEQEDEKELKQKLDFFKLDIAQNIADEEYKPLLLLYKKFVLSKTLDKIWDQRENGWPLRGLDDELRTLYADDKRHVRRDNQFGDSHDLYKMLHKLRNVWYNRKLYKHYGIPPSEQRLKYSELGSDIYGNYSFQKKWPSKLQHDIALIPGSSSGPWHHAAYIPINSTWIRDLDAFNKMPRDQLGTPKYNKPAFKLLNSYQYHFAVHSPTTRIKYNKKLYFKINFTLDLNKDLFDQIKKLHDDYYQSVTDTCQLFAQYLVKLNQRANMKYVDNFANLFTTGWLGGSNPDIFILYIPPGIDKTMIANLYLTFYKGKCFTECKSRHRVGVDPKEVQLNKNGIVHVKSDHSIIEQILSFENSYSFVESKVFALLWLRNVLHNPRPSLSNKILQTELKKIRLDDLDRQYLKRHVKDALKKMGGYKVHNGIDIEYVSKLQKLVNDVHGKKSKKKLRNFILLHYSTAL